MKLEQFKEVYMEAYETGCKGCTTYRPNDITGSVLSVSESEEKTPEVDAGAVVGAVDLLRLRVD